MNISVQRTALVAVGTALFVALSMCLQVPVFENYYLCLGYVVMAVYCWSFGTAAGTAAGTLGVVLYCLVINGLRGMPGWALGNLVIGLCIGPAFRASKRVPHREPPVRPAVPCARRQEHLCLRRGHCHAGCQPARLRDAGPDRPEAFPEAYGVAPLSPLSCRSISASTRCRYLVPWSSYISSRPVTRISSPICG